MQAQRTSSISFKRVEQGVYRTADGRYEISLNIGYAECTCAICENSLSGPVHGDAGMGGVPDRRWVVWDVERDDWAEGSGEQDGFATKRAAVEWLEQTTSCEEED